MDSRRLELVMKGKGIKRSKVPSRVRKAFERNNICYVLVTCEEPNQSGDMDVEMTFEGDQVLASYLLKNADELLDGQM